MAVGTQGKRYHTDQTHFLRKDIAYTDTGTITVGKLPPGAIVVGAGVVVTLKGGDGLTPDAKYVGPAGTGIAAHRTAILDERQAAVAAGAPNVPARIWSISAVLRMSLKMTTSSM